MDNTLSFKSANRSADRSYHNEKPKTTLEIEMISELFLSDSLLDRHLMESLLDPIIWKRDLDFIGSSSHLLIRKETSLSEPVSSMIYLLH